MSKILFEGDQVTKWIRLKAASVATGIPWNTVRQAARRGAIRSRRARVGRSKKMTIIWVDPESLTAFQKDWRPYRRPGRPKGSAKVKHRPKAQTALESAPKSGKAHK